MLTTSTHDNKRSEDVRALLTRGDTNLFLDDLALQARGYGWYGALSSLSMALVKFTSPGVPDIYQGNEVMDLSLVDPDNRRPVDYVHREALLDGRLPSPTCWRNFPARSCVSVRRRRDGCSLSAWKCCCAELSGAGRGGGRELRCRQSC